MKVTREVLERVGERFPFPKDALEELGRRRDRKRRNQRITAGAVGIAVFVAAIWVTTTDLPFDRSQTEGVPGGVGSGSTVTGPTETQAVPPDAEWDGYSAGGPSTGPSLPREWR